MELSRLLARLEEPDLKGRTIVVLTSDHGERLGEGGLAGHGQLHDSTLLVPLVIAAPGGEGAGASIDVQARSIDILPTILELAGLAKPAGIDGVSLLPAMLGQKAEIPQEAWSYSRSSGISLRLRNRIKYTFQNLAWSPSYGKEALYDLDRDPGEEHNLAAAPDSLRMRARVREIVEREAPGLRIRFENSGTVALAGRLESRSLERWSIKSFDLPCPCITFRRCGGAEFRVPPGQQFTLIIEPVADPRVHLSVAKESDGRPFETVFDMAAVETSEGAFLNGSSWQRGPPPTGPRTGVSLWWQDPRIGSDEADREERLQRQLKALGYLD